MLCFPNCKINIGLYITNKREDGFHDLETVFFPIKSFHDALEIIPTEVNAQLKVTGLDIVGNNEDNLVWKAYQMIRSQFPTRVLNLEICLRKALPMGAGLGGGSSDGSFMLKLLNDYCNLELKDEVLLDMALQLGSDCPFFIQNESRFAMSRGEQMSPIHIDLSNYTIQLVCPKVSISTGAVFKMITPRKAPFDLRQLPDTPINKWKDFVSNDFEYPVFQQHPILSNIKKQLYEQGAIYAAMSGTGSTVYGIFKKGGKATIQADLPFEEHITG